MPNHARRDQDQDQAERQLRIAQLERQFGILPGPEENLAPLRARLEHLLARHDSMQQARQLSAGQTVADDELRAIESEMRACIHQIAEMGRALNEQIIERGPPHGRGRWTGTVTAEGTNRWRVEVRRKQDTGEAVTVRVLRIAARRKVGE